MPHLLAIDAGGTSTRAVILTRAGQCLGYGLSGGGNPISGGFEGAMRSLLEAAEQARATVGRAPVALAGATIAMAGASVQISTEALRERFAALGLAGQVMIEPDLLAAFYSGTFHDDGYALIAGTGAVGARVAAGRLAAVADGAGWLLGDDGAGFWLGREVVRAVAAALDGRGPATSLTGATLAELGIRLDRDDRVDGRLRAQQDLISAVYALRPVELSRFARLALEAGGDGPGSDVVARDIVARAAALLARTLETVMAGGPAGPVVFGGSILTKGAAMAAAVRAGLGAPPREVIAVPDGMVGAAVMALKDAGVRVDADVFGRIGASLAVLRGA
ncbi:N-acetylglucosamine kinase [Specibacter cremeus]|uniref:N-acetylglucosamine kinase n=1 Tax=Specibacter cremeus TaxID=1629051 RepID=UPI0013DDCE51|nr:BadF/BadG/BcrA/BcrD ATPase family protein [Specibacter cremeus]